MKTLTTIFSGKKVKTVGLLAVVLLSITACNQILTSDIVRYADRSTYMATDTALRSVDRSFYSNFSMGNWYYQGASAQMGEVKAYIQIPDKLDMPEDVQVRYMQQIVCPKADQMELWYQLKNVELSVHLYTFTKQQSVSATCVNPLHHT